MNKKEIERHSNNLAVLMRQYTLGLQPPYIVKNAIRKLFADVYLEVKSMNIELLGKPAKIKDFDELWSKIE